MRSQDWSKLINLCKEDLNKTGGDKRSARGLLQRLTFFVYENKLIQPQRRKRVSVENQSSLNLLPPERQETLNKKLFDHTILGPGPYQEKDLGHTDCPVCEGARKNDNRILGSRDPEAGRIKEGVPNPNRQIQNKCQDGPTPGDHPGECGGRQQEGDGLAGGCSSGLPAGLYP